MKKEVELPKYIVNFINSIDKKELKYLELQYIKSIPDEEKKLKEDIKILELLQKRIAEAENG